MLTIKNHKRLHSRSRDPQLRANPCNISLCKLCFRNDVTHAQLRQCVSIRTRRGNWVTHICELFINEFQVKMRWIWKEKAKRNPSLHTRWVSSVHTLRGWDENRQICLLTSAYMHASCVYCFPCEADTSDGISMYVCMLLGKQNFIWKCWRKPFHVFSPLSVYAFLHQTTQNLELYEKPLKGTTHCCGSNSVPNYSSLQWLIYRMSTIKRPDCITFSGSKEDIILGYSTSGCH